MLDGVDETGKIRTKTLQWSCLGIGCLFVFGVIARNMVVKVHSYSFITGLSCGLFLFTLSYLIKKGIVKLPLGISFFSATLFFALISFSFTGPGFLAPAISLVLLIPIFAGFIGGRKSVLVAGFASFALLLLVYYFDRFQLITPVTLSREELMSARLVVLTAILIASVLTSFAYEYSHNLLLLLLQNRNEELKKANERLNRLVGSVAHDLRNPIGAIQGLTELLKENFADDEEVTAYIKSLELSAGVSLEMINTLLESSAMRSGKIPLNYSQFNVGELVIESWSTVAFLAAKKGIGHKLLPGEPVELFADRHRLHQVLTNLYTNAIKFTPAGKVVETKVSISEESVVITVVDHGVGMSEDQLKNIFDFESPTSTRGTNGEIGTGYGLPLVKQIVELHKGKIVTQSVINKGTSFHVYIPINTSILSTA